ncbi:hypothetical protein EJD97_017212 [Solanum chilense]|uniref:Uncharacterized protein n=1 Tax=Solanum chilense TaxID=4083 RepID=A0A6N2AG81_SOLCI|nr:hypothetical protein EJD97_017212 [Solanum chilense]
MVLGQYTQSNYVERGRASSHFGSIHRVERCRACHAIIALGKHTQSNDIRHRMLLSSLDSTHDGTT